MNPTTHDLIVFGATGFTGRLVAEYLNTTYGVGRDVKPKELAATYKRPEKLFDCCIDLGFQAVDTHSNALETARWASRNDVKSLRLVTHDWHMRRARLELDQAMPSNITVINDAVNTAPPLRVLLLEYNKFWLRWTAAQLGI